MGTNDRCRVSRGRSIGWKLKHNNQNLVTSLELEVKFVLKESKKM